VVNKIPEILQSRKAKDVLLVAVVLLLALCSFGLGRLSVPERSQAVALFGPQGDAAEALVTVHGSIQDTEHVTGTATGEYVASKNGTAYHLPWCGGAARIKEENKVWFATKTEAEAAGYKPAANCKGL